MVTDPDLVGLFIEPLERLDVSYMITGGVASVIYGDPRFTRDIDIVLELHAPDVAPLLSAFSDDAFYVPPEEVLREEAERPRGGHFNIIHRETALRADVYVAGDDPLHAWAFSRRERMRVNAFKIWVAPVEYVILRKLEYYRSSGSERHLRDVGMMFRISGDLVDEDDLEEWSARLEVEDELEEGRDYEFGM